MKLLLSMTTIQARLEDARRVLASFRDQTRPADETHLYVSREGYIFDTGIADPGPVAADVHFVPNTGPYRKLLPLLRERWNEDVLIVTIDDDGAYPPWFLERLVNGYERTGCITCFRAKRAKRRGDGRFKPFLSWPGVQPTEESVSLFNYPLGSWGILYSPRHFSERVFDEAAMKASPTACEPWLYGNTYLRGIKTCVLQGRFPMLRENEDCLWKINAKKQDARLRAVWQHLGAVF